VGYKTEIEIGVRGAAQLDKLRKQVNNLNEKVNLIENSFDAGIQSIHRYDRALKTATDTLRKARTATDDETQAIKQYVTALNNANAAQQRQNSLIEKEITRRGQATQALRKYNAELAGPRQPGGSMAGRYLRPGAGVATTQFTSPIGPEPDAAGAFMQRTQAASQAASRLTADFLATQRAARKLAEEQRRVNSAEFIQRTDAAARNASRLTAEFLASQRAARNFAEEQRRINSADFIQRTNAAAQAASRQTAEFIRQQRITKEIQKNLRSGTQFDAPIGPEPAKAKRGPSRLEKFGEFGLGAGFPLLFGGGAGQVLGGGLGTILGGGGPAGFGLQIAFSAIGGQIEDALRRIQEMDNALQALDMDALAESAITVNAELRQSVQNLVDMGENQKAVEVAANAVLQQTGVLPESISDSSNAVTLLSNVWDQVVAAVSGLLSLVGTPLVSALTLVLKLVGEGVKGINFFVSVIGVGIKRLVQLIGLIPGGDGLLEGIENATKGVNEASAGRLTTLLQTGDALDKELRREQEIFDIEKRRVAGNTAAAKLTNAQVTRDKDLAKLRQSTEDKIVEKRREFAGVTNHIGVIEREFQVLQIKKLANLEKERIEQKFNLDQQAAALLKQKEIDKERKELAKKLFETRVNESKIAQSGVQTQLNQIANEEKILQLRQQTAGVSMQLERALFEAQVSTLQLEESRLQRELQGLQVKETAITRVQQLIDAIAKNQVQQAKIQNKIAKLEIKQGIEKARIAQQQVQVEVQRIKLQIQMLRLKAEEIEDDARRAAKLREVAASEALNNKLTKAMVSSADKQLKLSVQIAKQKGIIANNILKGKLESIEAERVEKRRAAIAEKFAKETERASRANGSSGGAGGKRKGRTATTSLRIDPDVSESVKAGRTFGSIFELVEALDSAQRAKNRRLAREEQRRSQLSASSFNYSSMAPLGGLNNSEAVRVNVNTGPVIEFEGKHYVRMDEFKEGLREVARSTSQSSRYPGNRRLLGIR